MQQMYDCAKCGARNIIGRDKHCRSCGLSAGTIALNVARKRILRAKKVWGRIKKREGRQYWESVHFDKRGHLLEQPKQAKFYNVVEFDQQTEEVYYAE